MTEKALPLAVFQEARQLMERAQRIVIISHKNPDADAIGANLALREALERLGKTVHSACVDPVPENCLFLRGSHSFVDDFNPQDYDLFISVDCGGHKLVGFHESYPELMDTSRCTLINIDHHASNDHFGSVNIVMDETPSTCFILYLMFSSYGWGISPVMATAMLHGLYYDTGSFMHSNTDAQTLRIAGRLKALGGDHERCVKEQFRRASIEKLKLWGAALSRIEINNHNAAFSVLTEKDYTCSGAKYEDSSGIINYLSHIPDMRFSMLLSEDLRGNIKGSLRTQDDEMDLSEIAGLFGGGGHKKAAGFTIPGRLKAKTIWTIA